ncbi:MAG: hypothetical protein U9Q76_08525 [candidate division WOR-3 bacterium]|nr:hypothetical protein [candidate division WOR-3 bacterium]
MVKKRKVPTGSDVSSGTFKCNNCGQIIRGRSMSSLPPCPKCHGTSWRIIEGKGDARKDPYPRR